MDTQPQTYKIIFMVFLIILVSILIFALFRPGSKPTSLIVNGPFDLGSSQSIVPMSLDNTGFLKQGDGTFQCFVYMDNLAKTGEVNTCGIQPNQPSCASGLYGECQCSNINDCGNCAHPGYRELFSLYGVYKLEILNIPDASRQNAVSCQLVIRTTDAANTFIETISLPPLPVQKWVMISITKEGREMNIYFNDALVSSSKTINLPTATNIGGYVANAGASGLSGSIGLIYLSTEKLSSSKISSLYTYSTDTRGSPKSIETKSTGFSMATQFLQSSPILSNSFSLPQFNNVQPIPIMGGDGAGSQVSPLYNVRSSYA